MKKQIVFISSIDPSLPFEVNQPFVLERRKAFVSLVWVGIAILISGTDFAAIQNRCQASDWNVAGSGVKISHSVYGQQDKNEQAKQDDNKQDPVKQDAVKQDTEKQNAKQNTDPNSAKQNDDQSSVDEIPRGTGHLVRIPMPVTGNVAERVIASLERVLEKQPASNSGNRPILVIEFDNRNGTNGVGSKFEDCLEIANFLTSSKMNKLRTVAYLPGPANIPSELFSEDEKKQSTFESHVVLMALGCEEIAMHRDAAIGNAGIDMESIDELTSTAYRVIAAKRRVFPPLVALGMLEKSRVVYRVELKGEGFKYVDEAEYQKLNGEGKVIEAITISGANNFGFFSSEDLLNYRLIRHRVGSRKELADRYNLSPTALEGDPSLGQEWNAIRIHLSGAISSRMVTWIENALSTRINPDEINMVIVEIESSGGEPEAALRLANRLSEFDPMKVRTIAYIPERARGVSSIIAMGCDHLVMTGDGVLGGESRPELQPNSHEIIKTALKELGVKKEVNWSFFYGLIDPSFEVRQYKNRKTGRLRIMSAEEKDATDNPEIWQEIQIVDLAGGIDGESADALGLVRSLVEDFAEFKSFYQITDDPTLLEPTLADRWVENFAHQLASPRIAWMVLFGAIFFLSMEFSSPGLGVPGFLSAVCWMLFFWSQYFDGNASVLEILLFLVGVVFILIEFFVLPGFGIFGIGGAIMVTISIILAVQTFVIPTSAEEFTKLRTSLLTFVGASSGFFVALILFRRYVHRIPMLKRLMLDPNEHSGEEFANDIKDSLAGFEFLLGKTGTAQTRLAPSGKAIIDHQLYNVITDGRMIDKGTEIVVRNVVGNKIQVAISES